MEEQTWPKGSKGNGRSRKMDRSRLNLGWSWEEMKSQLQALGQVRGERRGSGRPAGDCSVTAA